MSKEKKTATNNAWTSCGCSNTKKTCCKKEEKTATNNAWTSGGHE